MGCIRSGFRPGVIRPLLLVATSLGMTLSTATPAVAGPDAKSVTGSPTGKAGAAPPSAAPATSEKPSTTITPEQSREIDKNIRALLDCESRMKPLETDLDRITKIKGKT